MRRQDREVTDAAQIREIIDRCSCMRLAFCDGAEPYIVPLSFGYTVGEDGYTFYFHSAPEGRKVTLLKSAPQVGFEMDCGYELHPGSTGCTCSAAFESIIGVGDAAILTDEAEKKLALEAILRRTTGRDGWEFQPELLEQVLVFRVKARQLSCKRHL